MKLVLGNRDAVESRDHGETWERMPKGKRATELVFPEGTSIGEALQIVTAGNGAWQQHVDTSETDADGAVVVPGPAWVAGDHAGLTALVAEHYGGVEIRELLDPYDVDTRKAPTRVLKSALAMQLVVLLMFAVLTRLQLLLKTNAGHDFQSRQMGGAASATNVAIYCALTANTTAPAAGDTTLTAEIVTAGLTRKAGTYAHTTGAANYTVTTAFTAQAADVPVTVGKRGLFDQLSGGLLVFTSLVSPTATLSAAGDTLTITDTVSI